MIDHVGVRVTDFTKALAFYREALAPIGYSVLMEFPDAAGLGAKGKPDLWIMKTDQTPHPTHVAIVAAARAHIDAFHAAGLSAGGTDNGPAGLRPFHPHYYAAFVLDPEGNNIEVVCHDDPAAPKANSKAKPAKKSAARVKAKAKAKPAKKAVKKASAKKPVAKATKATKKKR
ncbi:MAG TPA: VOC family protein [Polyangia bacterium]|jgi:catechol 2,3-dioxygenase-like lactoylglutathione lyase family enzyme|nr:VOC family protein [Polyangia bacterium]